MINYYLSFSKDTNESIQRKVSPLVSKNRLLDNFRNYIMVKVLDIKETPAI